MSSGVFKFSESIQRSIRWAAGQRVRLSVAQRGGKPSTTPRAPHVQVSPPRQLLLSSLSGRGSSAASMTLGETELTPTAVLAAVTGCPEAEVSRQPVRCKMTPVVWGSPLAASLPGLVVFTFTADVGRSRGPDDKIYVRSPWMRQHVPRGFSVVVARQERGTCDVVTVMQGPSKFDGVSKLDNDDVEETDPDVCIFDAAKVAKWQAAGTLQIVRQDKENGKFAIIKMFRLEGQLLAVGGSKNQHVVVSEETIGEVIEDRENRCLLSQIFFRIKEQWESLAGLFDAFPDYSLVGELCDGLHFVPIDNDIPEIKWFGLFGAGGVAMDPRLALGAVVDAGLPAVRYELLDARRGIEEVIREGRAGNGEGNVLYFRDEATGEVVLAKNKAAAYIVKRMARAILKAGGYSGLLFRLPKRIAEAAEYHQLCTSAAVRLCHQLFGLSEWMLLNRIPTTSMDINDTDRNGNVGPQGFASVWREYVASGAGQEMEVTPEDIGGAFDPDAFFKATRRSPQPLVGLTGAPKHVVFFQGVQGSGKSSLGAVLAKELASQGAKAAVLEQDQFGGHSPSCRSALEHMLKFSDLRVVLVTRCNANPKHYSAYVDIAHRCGARVSFLTPSQPPHDVALASALAGIAERSSSAPPGLLRLGPSLLPRDEVHRIVSMTLADFCPHPQGQIYNPLNTSSGALSRLPSPLPQPCGGPRAAWLYVEQHGAALRALRRPLEDIARELLPMVLEPPPEALVRPSLDTCTLVAFYPESAAAAAALAEVAQQHNPAAARDELHLTQLVITPDRKKRQEFLGGLRGVPTRMGERLSVRVSALVTRLEDGHMSFRVEVPEGTWIQSGRPHITVYVPSGHIAKESNFYVHKADNTVDTKELHPPLEIGMVCWWT